LSWLAADIGGTHVRTAVFHKDQLSVLPTVANLPTLNLMEHIQSIGSQYGPFQGAGFAIAGPVTHGAVQMTNAPHRLVAEELVANLGCPVELINDFGAQALAIPQLEDHQKVQLNPIVPFRTGHMAVIGPGTGLGEALLVWDGSQHLAVSGEGSHTRFAPKNPREQELLSRLLSRWPAHVSVERVVSGPGLCNIYETLRDADPQHAERAESLDPATISSRAIQGECPLCVETLHIMVDTLADEAASLVLKCNATAVYLTGGIVPKILPIIKRRFQRAFENKGRYRPHMERVAIFVVTEPNLGLYGAIRAAMKAQQ
jgi:glucokinase